jgi:hypothetical protein
MASMAGLRTYSATTAALGFLAKWRFDESGGTTAGESGTSRVAEFVRLDMSGGDSKVAVDAVTAGDLELG